jgi:hypothetical protein
VKHDEAAILHRGQVGRDFRDQRIKRRLAGGGVLEKCAGVGGIGRRERRRDRVEPDLAVLRVQPRMRIDAVMVMDMVVTSVIVVSVIVMRMVVVIMVDRGGLVIGVIVMACSSCSSWIVIVLLKGRAVPEPVRGDPRRGEQFDRNRIRRERVDRALQPRRQRLADPDHDIRRLQRRRLGRAHRIAMRGRPRRENHLRLANALHDCGDKRMHGGYVGDDCRLADAGAAVASAADAAPARRSDRNMANLCLECGRQTRYW